MKEMTKFHSFQPYPVSIRHIIRISEGKFEVVPVPKWTIPHLENTWGNGSVAPLFLNSTPDGGWL
jgi:hypothetical protein